MKEVVREYYQNQYLEEVKEVLATQKSWTVIQSQPNHQQSEQLWSRDGAAESPHCGAKAVAVYNPTLASHEW